MDGPTRAARMAAIDATLPGESLLEAIGSYPQRIALARTELRAALRDNEVLEAQLRTSRRTLQQAIDAREEALEQRRQLVCQLATYLDLLDRVASLDEEEVETALVETRAVLREARSHA